MKDDFGDVQRIVLAGDPWEEARHLVLRFRAHSAPLHFLQLLLKKKHPTAASASNAPAVQLSLGFSRRGLQSARVPAYVLACFAAKAPAFAAGAALRAASHGGSAGSDPPAQWDPAFAFLELDAVLSLHASDPVLLDDAIAEIQDMATQAAVQIVSTLPPAQKLPAPAGQQFVHFGYRDNLSRVGIHGWTEPTEMAKCLEVSKFAAGEFVLGHPQDSGANPWIAMARQKKAWPEELRSFFRNGSFGVLHQMEQDVAGFESFVSEAAAAKTMGADEVKAKLCGRTPSGLPLAAASGARPEDDFDYAKDLKGEACPFGSHVRRMNPRGGALAHAARSRPLLRRGMPYGPDWQHPPQNQERGLLGHFFCASIEDQFEHLLGQWADRVPLGSDDGGGARDPLIGAHESGDGGFEIPMKSGPPHMLRGLRPFTRTRGTAYLFYPSLTTLARIARNEVFADLREDDA